MDKNSTILKEMITSNDAILSIIITKEEVMGNDFSKPIRILQQLVTDSIFGHDYREKVDISFSGYGDTKSELWEIPDVRSFVEILDLNFPFWLYFLSKDCKGLMAIILCFLPPFQKTQEEREAHGELLRNYFDEKGFPAMNTMCDLCGISLEENLEMTRRSVNYFFR